MRFIESWRESLALVMPRQAKVMLLVTLKSLSDLFYNPFAIVTIISLSMTIAFSMAFCSLESQLYVIPCIITYILSNILVVFMILYVRPSVMLKHRFYFMNYWGHVVYVGLFYGVVGLIAMSWSIPFPGFLWFVWAPIATFWILFFVDSHVSINSFVRSFIRALKMFAYNLPVCLIITIVWFFLFRLVSAVPIQFVKTFFDERARVLFFLVDWLVGIIFFPVWYCLMSNLYVKRLHDQFSLYFGRPIS